MGALIVGLVIFAFVFGGGVAGLLLRGLVPAHHLSDDTKEVVKLGTGLIGTMAALLLGLLVASAKSSYDRQGDGISEMAGKIMLLDRILAHYGPEAAEARASLRRAAESFTERLWGPSVRPDRRPITAPGEAGFDALLQLSPKSEAQQAMRSYAQELMLELGRTRVVLFAQQGSAIAWPFLIVVVFWLTLIFVSLGLFAPRNLTVYVTLLVCALSVSGAIFLILELDHPFHGLIQLSDGPIRAALAAMSS